MLTQVRGTLIDELLHRNGGERILRVDSDDIAPEFMPGDYLGFADPSEHAPRAGDCVLVREPDGRPSLRIFEDLAGQAMLMPVLMSSDDDVIFGADAIEGVALWLHRTAAQQAPPLRLHRPVPSPAGQGLG